VEGLWGAGDWDLEEVVYEEGDQVYGYYAGKNQSEEHFAFAPSQRGRKSGDGTVPYHSLSWCHTWMGDKVNITRLPQTELFEEEQVEVFRDTAVDGFATNHAQASAAGVNTFYEERRVDPADQHKMSHTAVWELDQVEHREVIGSPVFLRELLHQIESQQRAQMDVRFQMQNVLSQVTQKHNLFATKTGARHPNSDDGCFWDYGRAQCAWPQHCEFRFTFGDLSATHSCKLRSNSTAEPPPSSDEECTWDYSRVKCANPQHCEYRYTLGDFFLSHSCLMRKPPEVPRVPRVNEALREKVCGSAESPAGVGREVIGQASAGRPGIVEPAEDSPLAAASTPPPGTPLDTGPEEMAGGDVACVCEDAVCYHGMCKYARQCEGGSQPFGPTHGWWGSCPAGPSDQSASSAPDRNPDSKL